MTSIDKLALAGKKAKGQRPYFMQDKQTEQVMSIAMALAMELNVARERIDSLERILEQKGILSADEVDSFVPDKAEADRRSIQTQEYLARVLRILQQNKEELMSDDPSVAEVVTALGGSNQ